MDGAIPSQEVIYDISFEFYWEWLETMRRHTGRPCFAVGEYWSSDLQSLIHYLDVAQNSLSLFDVPLYYNFLKAAISNGQFDMRTLFDNRLKPLLKLRERFAYGEQMDYFDDPSVVGFTRLGDEEHPGSGMAVLVTDSAAGEKWMYVGKRFAGSTFYDALAGSKRTVEIDSEGWGTFYVENGSAAAWITEQAYQCARVQIK